MNIPQLRTASYAAGPRWAPVGLNRAEILAIARLLVMIVGYNDRTRKEQVLGSGFLVGTEPELIALTAQHVIRDFVNTVRPAAPHSFSGLHGDEEDVIRRTHEVAEAELLFAIVRCRAPGSRRITKVIGISYSPSPWNVDIACLRLQLPAWTSRKDFDAVAIDADPHPYRVPVIMAGWSGGSWELPEHEGHPFSVRQHLTVRAGYNLGEIRRPLEYEGNMFLIDAPSEPGMSGGPLIATRPSLGPGLVTLTVKGVISRDCIAEAAAAPDEADPHRTWVSPIEDAFHLSLPRKPPDDIWLGEAVRAGLVRTYGQRVRRARVVLTEENTTRLFWDDPWTHESQ